MVAGRLQRGAPQSVDYSLRCYNLIDLAGQLWCMHYEARRWGSGLYWTRACPCISVLGCETQALVDRAFSSGTIHAVLWPLVARF